MTTALVFSSADFDGHEQVVFCRNDDAGLKAIIAIHDTTLGAALGGCRVWPYETEADALSDALRLSRGMTFKNALAGLDLGGGKAVILADPRTEKTSTLLHAFGRAVDRLGGRYVTAEDVGVDDADMEEVARVTPHVRGTRATGLGDPSPFTAYGVFEGLRSAVAHRFGGGRLDGLTVAVQGVGHVGAGLARLLAEAGARLVVADLNEKAATALAEELGARIGAPGTIHAEDVDVFAPCALGAVLNAGSIPAIRAGVVAGAANNQLASDADGERLMRRGILYAPDYVINAGGVISIAEGRPGSGREAMLRRVARIGRTLETILSRAQSEKAPPHRIADRMARERIAAARRGERRQAS